MSDARHFILAHDTARRTAAACCMLPEYQGYHVWIKPPTRTIPENSLLHALIAEVADKLEWAGAKRDAETWKRLLVAAWCRVHGESVEVLPALDGYGVDIIPARTSKLTKKECADLIEYIYAWGTGNGVRFDEDMRKVP